MGRTSKPCPGCGRSEKFPFRDADRVCGTCQAILSEGRAAREIAEKDEDCIEIELAWYSLGQLFHVKRETSALLYSAMRDLVMGAVKTARPTRYNPNPFNILDHKDNLNADCRYWMDRGTADLIHQIVVLVKRATTEAYQAGFRDGNNLLSRLIAGTISLAECNAISISKGSAD